MRSRGGISILRNYGQCHIKLVCARWLLITRQKSYWLLPPPNFQIDPQRRKATATSRPATPANETLCIRFALPVSAGGVELVVEDPTVGTPPVRLIVCPVAVLPAAELPAAVLPAGGGLPAAVLPAAVLPAAVLNPAETGAVVG